MCSKYEDQYAYCFDQAIWDFSELLRTDYGVVTEDYDAFQKIILDALDKAHETGVIKPVEDKEE